MANLPNPQSYEQLLADMLAAYASKQGIDDFNVGSAVTSFFEVVALSTARSSGDVFQILRDFSVDRATGDTLKRIAVENRVKLISAKPATGQITVTDSTFTKISSKIYAGASSPNIGSTQIKVSDASAFTPTGAVYVGRGTANVEGPIAYSSITPVGGYYVLNLNAPTSKFHNIGETVILAQGGNRSVPANTIAISPSSGASPDISFTVTTGAIILDGETSVSAVSVSAQTPGSDGNIPRGAIKSFSSPPFSGAKVTNELPFTTGTDSESDDQLRIRIKRVQASKGLGTATAIKSSVIGATPSDESATIVSSEIITDSNGATVIIDNGDGYEAKTAGVGLESIVDSALGGEQYFQLTTGGRQAPVAKAFMQTTLPAPFDIKGGDTLALTVGETTYQHIFADTDFRSPGGVTAFEVTASINADTELGFEATTAEGGQFVVLRAKEETNDTLKIATPTTSGRDAAVQLGLPSNEIQTLRLYKNKSPLSQYGKSASIFTQNQQLWSATIATGDTLALAVDGTGVITYTITDGDFIATGLYTTASYTNSLDSWAQVLNAKLTGVTVTVVGTQLKITSNLGASNRAQLVIDPSSTLVTKGMFSSTVGIAAQGKASDFSLSRNTAQFKLTVPLEARDQLTSGSEQTEARLVASQVPGGSLTLTGDAHLWMLIDAPGVVVPNAIAGNTVLSIQKPSQNIIRYTSTVTTALTNVQVGDYAIIWSAEVDASDRIEGRVYARTNSTFDILVTPTEWAAAATTNGVVFSEGIVFLRANNVPQKFTVAAGSKTLDQVAAELQGQTTSLVFTVLEEQYLVVRTRTKDSDGRVYVVTADAIGKLLGFAAGAVDVSKDSLIANYESGAVEATFPLFLHSAFADGSSADPIASYITSVESAVSIAQRDPNELIRFLMPYGSIRDTQPFGENVQESAIASNGTTISIAKNADIRRVRAIDRYFLANPLDFGASDSAVVVLDGDTSSKSFEIPFFRRAITNTSLANNPSAFNAYDVDSGSSTNFQSAFGSTFDFSNFKALMKARKVLKATGVPKTAILYRASRWGRSGEKINVGYTYPSQPNSTVGSTFVVGTMVDIRINLKSGATAPSSHDASTEWNVTITPNTPAGTDQVTYTWNGTGTNPSLTLNGGEYVNIGTTTELSKANTGVFRISTQTGFAPNATSFTVTRPTGVAVAELNKATIVASAIQFYQSAATTAADIATYVNANLQDYMSATLVNDGGTDGSGVIARSTYEDSAFTVQSYFLKDGINWIASSSLGGSAQFTFKKPLALPADSGYAFNAGEEVRLIPTTMEQVRRLISVLAVSGFTTVGAINLVDRGTKLELASDVLGSDGSIQIIGGSANDYGVPVLDSATRINNLLMLISADKVAAQSVHSDQWFKLQATTFQRKEALLSSNSSVNVLSNSPTTGQSTVKLTGRAMNQRYFGRPRHHIRSLGRTFRVEKQGNLVCLSWDGTGNSPVFLASALDFNASVAGTLNVSLVSGTSEAEVIILTGSANFNSLSIGDLVTFSGLPQAGNNGQFLVTGVSDDGRTVRVLNPSAVNEYSAGSFTFVTNAVSGDIATLGAFSLTAGTDFTIGSTPAATAANFAAVAGTLSGITASATGTVVKITAQSPSASVPLSYTGSGTVAVTQLAGDAYSSSTFSASSEVSEGDTVTLSSPFAVLNQGRYRVIRRYNDSIWFENPNVIEEEVTLPPNLQTLGVDSTTSLKVNATNHTQYVSWNGTGTEPQLGNAQMGDIMNFGTDFTSDNMGTHMVIRSGAKRPEITALTMPTGGQISSTGAGQYFVIYSAGDLQKYAVWFNVSGGSNFAPSVSGAINVQINITAADPASLVATKVAQVLNVTTGLTAVASGAVTTVTTTGSIETTHASNGTVSAPFSADVNQAGLRTFVEALNAAAVSQSSVTLSTSFMTCHRPQMMFKEYEGTNVGDKIVVTGNTLGATNAGSFTIASVIDRDTVIVTGSMAPAANISLNGRETSVFVEEGVLYSGYKQVLFASAQPGAPVRNYIVFNTNAQSEKINEAAGVELSSLNKMDYKTVVRKGLDSYRYNTGLIAEANRIIYGDSRDPQTYPGVGAAGAEIFVREPLTRRVQISVDIRIATGVPFAQIAEQVRTSVSSLVNSNAVGQSIAISAIVAAVNSIPGVRAMAISSPQYDSTHDIIKLAPSEKARIIDPTTDISVSQIGN